MLIQAPARDTLLMRANNPEVRIICIKEFSTFQGETSYKVFKTVVFTPSGKPEFIMMMVNGRNKLMCREKTEYLINNIFIKIKYIFALFLQQRKTFFTKVLKVKTVSFLI